MREIRYFLFLVVGLWIMCLLTKTVRAAYQEWKVAEALDRYEKGVAVEVSENSSLDIILPDDVEALINDDVPVPDNNLTASTESENALPPAEELPIERKPTKQVSRIDNSQDIPEGTVIDVLELKDMDIKDVLKLISDKSGLNIIAGTNVMGKVTIYLKDVKVRDAMRIVLDTNNLAYKFDDGIVRVMPAKEFEDRYGYSFGGQLETRVVHLLYADAAELSALLNQIKSTTGKVIVDAKSKTMVLMDTPENLDVMEHLIQEVDVTVETKVFELTYAPVKELSEKITEVLTKDVGKVKFDERSNKIIVTDTPSKLRDIGRIVQTFDVKETQVLIEAKIVQIILSDQHKFGVDWEAIVSDFHNVDLHSDFDILKSSDKRGTLSIGTIASDDYTALVEALETVGITNILSNPSISTLNNQEAKILVGSTEPYVTTTTTTPASGPTTTAESVNFIDVGVKLFVTPTIHRDKFITMKIKPEVSSVTRSLTTSNNNSIPIVETSEAETTVMVKDGVTIVIGGLIKEEKIQSQSKIPILGSIPIIGHAFRNNDDLVEKTEIAIFLTPKIMSGDVSDQERLDEVFSSSKTK